MYKAFNIVFFFTTLLLVIGLDFGLGYMNMVGVNASLWTLFTLIPLDFIVLVIELVILRDLYNEGFHRIR